MESEQAGLYEGLAENWADMLVSLIRILMQVFVRVRQKMPFEEWYDVYMEEQGYRQEEYVERMTRAIEELRGISPDDTIFVCNMMLKKISKKLERLEIPEPIKEFLSNLPALIKPLTAEQSPVYECDDCHQQFALPQEDFEKIRCPQCGKEWTKEELPDISS